MAVDAPNAATHAEDRLTRGRAVIVCGQPPLRRSAARGTRCVMTARQAWVGDENVALLTDLYELTMVEGYLVEGFLDEAVFSLFVRRLPRRRNFLLACGLDDALGYLERLRFSKGALAYLSSLGLFSERTLGYLAKLRFTGEVYAVPEGTPVFGGEPLLEVVAPLPVAQLRRP